MPPPPAANPPLQSTAVATNRHRRWRIVYNSMQAKAKPKAQLGDRRSQSHEPRVGRGKSPPNPSSIHQVESIQSVGSVGSIASIHPKKSNIPYWYCLPCTPSLILPPSSLKCLQKSNPNIHRKCFRCFKCFGCFRCFISLLDHKTARFWSKSEQTRTKPKKSAPTRLRHIMGAENTQKSNSPTCRQPYTVLQAITEVISAKPTFCSLPSYWILQTKNRHLFFLLMGWNRCLL